MTVQIWNQPGPPQLQVVVNEAGDRTESQILQYLYEKNFFPSEEDTEFDASSDNKSAQL